MLQILYNILQKNKDKVLNNDTMAMKLVDRVLGNILLCCLMHSLYLTYFGHLIHCGGNDANFSEGFVDQICWTLGVNIYANKTKLMSEFWEWEYEPVQAALFPAVSGKPTPADFKVYLTHISKLPMYFMSAVACTLFGKMCWSFLLGSFLHDLVGPLDSVNKDKVAKPVLKEDEKELLLDETAQVFIRHIRFYDEITGYYIVCLLINVAGLCLQAYCIVNIVGGMDPQFGFKVLYFSFTEYVRWPIELLRIFPSIGICTYRQNSKVGNLVPYEYVCDLPWNHSYLLLFAAIYLLLLVCIILSCLSLLYHTIFLFFPCMARRELKNMLKLHPSSNASKAMRFIPSGGIFMLILLAKNVQYDQICVVLEKIRGEVKVNRRRFIRNKLGIL